MRRRSSKITVTSAAGLARGVVLAIDVGENMELVRVRWPWWWRFAAWLRRLALNAWWAAQRLLCGLRGHRLTVESRDIDGRCFTLYCWCAGRYEYIGDEEGSE